MILDGTPIGFIPCRDPAAVRGFYEDVLGLELIAEDVFSGTYDGGGTPVRLTRVAGYAPPSYTVFGWEVDDLDQAVSELGKRDVAMERFEGVPQDDLGVWTAPDGTRVAWFRDPGGSVLSLTEQVA